MGTIKQATYGDEKSSTDITDSLVNMYRKGKGYIELKVGPQLLEVKEAGEKVELTDTERDEVRKQAEEACGNALDAECIRTTTESLRASKLAKKAREEASQSIVGERLTVSVIGNDGKEKTLVAPKDNIFKFGAPPPGSNVPLDKAYDTLKSAFTERKLYELLGTAFVNFVWVFGTAFAWVMLGQSYSLPDGELRPNDYWWLKWVGAFAGAITLGYGGFVFVVLVFFVLGLMHYIGRRKALLTGN